MRRERLFLEDIVAAADCIAEFIQELDRRSFEDNRLVRSAVVHQLTIIGEAVARLSPELRARHAQVPWADIKGFRNIIVHNYFGIDWEEVWRSAVTSVPMLRTKVLEVIRAEFPPLS